MRRLCPGQVQRIRRDFLRPEPSAAAQPAAAISVAAAAIALTAAAIALAAIALSAASDVWDVP